MMIGHLGEEKRNVREEKLQRGKTGERKARATFASKREERGGGSLHEAVRARRRKDEEEGMI